MSPNRSTWWIALGAALLILGGACVVWRVYSSRTKPSPLVTDAGLANVLYDQVLPGEHRILTQDEHSNCDGQAGRFERTLTCTVMRTDNAPLDRDAVCEALDKWLAEAVDVRSTSDEDSRDSRTRTLKYGTGDVSGEFRYTLEAVPDATISNNGVTTPSSHESLRIQITEHLGDADGSGS